MSSSIFSQLPNNVIMNIINIHHIQEEKEKKIRKDSFSKCMKDINEVPYHYSRTYITEEMAKEFNIPAHKCPVFNTVSNEFWTTYHQSGNFDYDDDYIGGPDDY